MPEGSSTHRSENHRSPLATRHSPDERSEVVVLIPAAGRGTRLGGERKQFRTLGGAPLLVQTLRVFGRHPGVGALVVAAPAEHVAAVEDDLRAAALDASVTVTAGGASRQASVRAALEAAPETTEVVLVHDAVRAFVPPDGITAVIAAVRAHGAAALAVPVADTLRRGGSGCFEDTVPRAGLYRMQTPQGFRRAWLAEAHAKAAADGYAATDDVDLVQRLGHAVRIVEGDARNIKITTPADWALAQMLWQEVAG